MLQSKLPDPGKGKGKNQISAPWGESIKSKAVPSGMNALSKSPPPAPPSPRITLIGACVTKHLQLGPFFSENDEEKVVMWLMYHREGERGGRGWNWNMYFTSVEIGLQLRCVLIPRVYYVRGLIAGMRLILWSYGISIDNWIELLAALQRWILRERMQDGMSWVFKTRDRRMSQTAWELRMLTWLPWLPLLGFVCCRFLWRGLS